MLTVKECSVNLTYLENLKLHRTLEVIESTDSQEWMNIGTTWGIFFILNNTSSWSPALDIPIQTSGAALESVFIIILQVTVIQQVLVCLINWSPPSYPIWRSKHRYPLHAARFQTPWLLPFYMSACCIFIRISLLLWKLCSYGQPSNQSLSIPWTFLTIGPNFVFQSSGRIPSPQVFKYPQAATPPLQVFTFLKIQFF